MRRTRNSLNSAPPLPVTTMSEESSPGPSQPPLAGTSTDSTPPLVVSSPAAAPPPLTPEFIAAVAKAVQDTLNSERLPSASSQPSPGSSTATPLDTRATELLAQGQGHGGQPSGSGSAPSADPQPGRSNFVPPFLATFAVPTLSSASSVVSTSLAPISSAMPSVPPQSYNIPSLPVLGQPFVIGPGFSPVAPKLVSLIVSGKFVELVDLLSTNAQQPDPEPQLLFDGRVVLTPAPRRNRRQLDDILSWVEAFSVFEMVLVSHFPLRWRDLAMYKLLIVRTYRQFGGKVWLNYDRAFREHAAASQITDWSVMNVQLYNFHAAGASVSRGTSSLAADPVGSESATEICKSWNRGKCSSPFASCRFAHKCSNCRGRHRASECERQDKRDRSRSPSRSAHDNSKSKRS